MKAILVVLLLMFAASARADIVSDLTKFFNAKRQGTTLTILIDQSLRGDDSARNNARSLVLGYAPAWAAQIKTLGLSLSKTELPAEKALLLELRRTHNALTAVAADKAKAEEALRALDSLRTQVSRMAGTSTGPGF